MKNMLRAITAAVLLVLASTVGASAQCSGQAPAATYCGNPTGSIALPGWKAISGLPFALVVGSTGITGGTNNGLLYNNGGVLGNLTTTTNGVLQTSAAGVPAISQSIHLGGALPATVTRFYASDLLMAGKSISALDGGTTLSAVMADNILTVSGNSVYADVGAFRAVSRQFGAPNGYVSPTAASLGRAGEFHALRDSSAVATSGTWAVELGTHSQTTGNGTTETVGIYNACSHTNWLPTGARCDTAHLIGGEDGWNHALRYLDTDGTTVLFDVDKFGSVTSLALNTGSAIISGIVQLTGEVSPTILGSNQNDYDPGSFIYAARLSASTPVSITGRVGSGSIAVSQLFVNVGSFNITLVNESGSSTAANRFHIANDIVLTPGSAVLLRYDPNLVGGARWTNVSYVTPALAALSGLGTGVATALGINVGSAGAFVVNGGALGTPSSGTITNLTGTASININGTVGATTPATGAFSTLVSAGDFTVTDGVTKLHSTTTTNLFNLYATIASSAASGAFLSAYTKSLPAAANDRIGGFLFGYTADEITNRNAALIAAYASEVWTAGTAQGTYLEFQTTANGGASRTGKVRMHGSGGTSIGNGALSTDPGAGQLLVETAISTPLYKSTTAPTAVSGAGPILIGSASTISFRMKVTLNGTDYWLPASTTAY